ncbi:MAG: FHA domain-containing protein [Candidatus Obscuribacterales bacterium]|nr:FHA domain-containing protein [Candidatus Obscuribacterales bacterium]
MTSNETSSPLKQGRICPVCKTIAEVDDLFCSSGCGHAFSDADPIVQLNSDGSVHDPATDDASTNVQASTVVHVDDADTHTPALAPSSEPQPAVQAPAIAQPAASTQANADNTAGNTSCKLCYIEVSVDLDPRPLRPDDVVAPTVPSTGYTLSGVRVPFGRMSPVIPILGDQTVSRVHGYFHRTPAGGYELQCDTENFTEVNGVEIAKGQTVALKDGDAIKIGDFFLIVYHEQD